MKKLALILLILCKITTVYAIEQFEIKIKNHKFIPSTFEFAAGKKIKLIVENQDNTPEEFESHDLNQEKIILGKKKAVFLIGPLKPGKYNFFGEFNPKTAQGVIIVK
ncbi:MAG: cupredoxin domain-containing protein [Rickettsiales bacterium]